MSDAQLIASVVFGVLAAVAVLTFGIVFTVTWVDAGYQRRQCDRFSLVSGRATQFRQFSHWSYDCYVRSADGKWVLKDQLRDVTQ